MQWALICFMIELISLSWLNALLPAAAYITALTAVLLIFGRDWRVILPVLLAQYTAVALLLSESLTLYLAFSKIIVGLFITLMLYVTVRQLFDGGWSSARDASVTRPLISERLRLAVAVIAVIVIWILTQQLFDSGLAMFVAYTLIVLGVFAFATTTEPLYLGLGLLMVLSGIELFYLGRTSLLAMGFLAAAHLITVIVVAYLAQTQAAVGTPLVKDVQTN